MDLGLQIFDCVENYFLPHPRPPLAPSAEPVSLGEETIASKSSWVIYIG
jgi:hypothetical protein